MSKKEGESMKIKVVEKPIVFVDIVEVGEYYTDKLITIKANCCSMEDAKKDARDAGYQVIDECCYVVPTNHEVHITVAVEPEGN
jgi:hypothetical protein